MTNQPIRLVLLDAHAILHRAYHALPDFATSSGEPTGALYGLSAMIIKIVEDLKPDYVVACYDLAGPTYRHEIYKEYKAGRKKADDDLVAQMIRSRDIFTALDIPVYDKPGFEADDMLGTIVEQVRSQEARKQGSKGGESVEIIIASGDMDTLQLVSGTSVKAYTLKKGIKDTVMYDEEGVRARFGFGPELIPDYKGLSGDPSDNIVGVKGIGDKTATTLITTFGTIENMYKELDAGHEDKFLKAGIKPRIIELLKEHREEAEFSKMLATIRRDAPIEFKLPEKKFKEGVDLAKVKTLWSQLEFRTLSQRLEKVVKGVSEGEGAQDTPSARARAAVSSPSPSLGPKGPSQPSPSSTPSTSLFSAVPPDDLQKTAVALWIINSNLTNPTLDDILNFGNTEDYEVAKQKIFETLEKRGLQKVYDEIEFPLIPVIHAMEERGVKIDKPFLAKLSKDYTAELSKLEKKIWQLAGTEFNIASPKQLGEILFDKLGLKVKNQKKTEGGARSTRESELEKMRDLHPIVPLIFEYRELAKLLGTYIDAIPPLLDSNNRLHTHYIQSGSTTGRMASQNPGLQNIPIKTDLGKAIRGAFIAEKGFKLAAFDYSQMELRIAAFMSGDEKLIGIFKRGEDVHASVASFVFKVPLDQVTPTMRRQAKVINFGIIYGMGVLALKQNLGTSRDEAQKFLNDYFDTFSTLAAYLDRVKVEAAQSGYTETLFGRRRSFEGIKSKIPYIRAQAERMAINAPIQGTGADIIKKAMIKVHEYIREQGLEKDVYLILQVHDELVCEIKEKVRGGIEKIAADIEKIMESVVQPEKTQGVKLEATIAIGDNWGELK